MFHFLGCRFLQLLLLSWFMPESGLLYCCVWWYGRHKLLDASLWRVYILLNFTLYYNVVTSVLHCNTMLGRLRFSVAAPRVWNSLPLGLKTSCDSLRGFKTGLKTYLFRQDYNYSQCHSAPQITVISLELWRFINYITYLLTYLLTYYEYRR